MLTPRRVHSMSKLWTVQKITADTKDKVPFGSTLPAEPRGPGDAPRQRRNRRVREPKRASRSGRRPNQGVSLLLQTVPRWCLRASPSRLQPELCLPGLAPPPWGLLFRKNRSRGVSGCQGLSWCLGGRPNPLLRDGSRGLLGPSPGPWGSAGQGPPRPGLG